MNGLNRVNPGLARAVREAGTIFARGIPGVSIRVTSGYRSASYQHQLAAAWDRGDRDGLTSRPAIHSSHTAGRAVDLAFAWRGKPISVSDTPSAYFQALEHVLAPAGVRRIGTNHFEV